MHSLLTETKIRILLVIAGVLTSSMLLITLDPAQYFSLFFAIDIDVSLNNGSELLVVDLMVFIFRSWGFLIFLLGMGLLVSVFDKRFRLTSVLIAGVSKVFFVMLILAHSDLVLPGFLFTLIVDSVLATLLLGLGLVGLTELKSSLFRD